MLRSRNVTLQLAILGLPTLALVVLAGPAEGLCWCRSFASEEAEIQANLDQSAMVFAGRVVRIREPEPEAVAACEAVDGPSASQACRRTEIEFVVDRAWAGVEARRVVIGTYLFLASCGYDFVKGQSYLVYATGSPDTIPTVTYCSRTRLMRDASVDLERLGAPSWIRHGGA